MLELLKTKSNQAFTENGGAAYATTGSACLDLFSAIGALRSAEEKEIAGRFARAYAEDPDLAVRIVFYGRDVRGGLGERRVFRVILRYLAQNEPESVRHNLENIAEYGRYDDLLVLLGTSCEEDMLRLVAGQLRTDTVCMQEAGQGGSSVSLLAKWLPSVNASDPQTVAAAKYLARALGMRQRDYRRLLSALRARIAILENNLRERDYSFDYAKQPSCAVFRYRQAFLRNDKERYEAFLGQVQKGEAVMHTGTLFPYDVIRPCLDGRALQNGERASIDTTWNALPDYTDGRNALAVVDGSGSMYWEGSSPTPAEVALSLGIYFAEHNKGAYRNHFITFSEHPRLVEIKGRDLYERVRYCMGYNEVANTNLEAVFDLILDTAVENRLEQADLPEELYIISDMEFDGCTRGAGITNFENAKQRYAKAGYRLPQVIFWNVSARNEQHPVTQNEQGAVLVSGCSPNVFEMAVSGDVSPYQYMKKLLLAERYARIGA